MDTQPSITNPPAKGSRDARKGSLVLLLFGLPFAGAGLSVLWFLLLPMLQGWQASQHWVPVEAQVLHAELKTSRSSKGGATYQAMATYRYRYDGREYSSDRVSLGKGSDNIGRFQEEAATALIQAQRNAEPVMVYVDPQQPARAVYRRDLRPGMVGLLGGIGLLFAAVGIGIMVTAIRARLGLQALPAATRTTEDLLPTEEPLTDTVVPDAEVDRLLGLRQTGRGVQWSLPAGRASSSVWLVLGVVFAGAGVFAGRQGGWTALVPVFVFGGIGLLLLASGLWQCGNALMVDIVDNWVTIRRSLFGIKVWQQTFPLGKVRSIAVGQGMIVRSGTQTRFYYRAAITTLSGESFTVADNLCGLAVAMSAARRMASLTGWTLEPQVQLFQKKWQDKLQKNVQKKP